MKEELTYAAFFILVAGAVGVSFGFMTRWILHVIHG